MREIVYLSEGKLEQFLPDLRSLWPRPKLAVKAPFATAEVNLAPSARKLRLQHFNRIMGHIERSAKWFTDPTLTAGEWAAFESPLSYLIASYGDEKSMLLFATPAAAASLDPSGASVQLLLHGSPRHLVGGAPIQIPSPQGSGKVMVEPPGSTPAEYVNNVSLLMFDLDANSFSMATAQPKGTLPANRLSAKITPGKAAGGKGDFYRGIDYLPVATRDLLHAIEARVGTSTAAWMSGYARITANLAGTPMAHEGHPPRYLVASPLYVERTAAPASL